MIFKWNDKRKTNRPRKKINENDNSNNNEISDHNDNDGGINGGRKFHCHSSEWSF